MIKCKSCKGTGEHEEHDYCGLVKMQCHFCKGSGDEADAMDSEVYKRLFLKQTKPVPTKVYKHYDQIWVEYYSLPSYTKQEVRVGELPEFGGIVRKVKYSAGNTFHQALQYGQYVLRHEKYLIENGVIIV